MPNRELLKLERQIARSRSGPFPRVMVIWPFANLICWLSLWPLVLTGAMPLWAGFIVATANLALVYLPTHDAQHDIIARPGQKLRWLNELVGHATSWMLVVPFNALRHTHLEHHKHSNDQALDPDISTHAAGPWAAIWQSIRHRQPDGRRVTDYLAALARVNRQGLVNLLLAYRVVYFAILFMLAWSGYALEAALLWWLPLHIASTPISLCTEPQPPIATCARS